MARLPNTEYMIVAGSGIVCRYSPENHPIGIAQLNHGTAGVLKTNSFNNQVVDSALRNPTAVNIKRRAHVLPIHHRLAVMLCADGDGVAWSARDGNIEGIVVGTVAQTENTPRFEAINSIA